MHRCTHREALALQFKPALILFFRFRQQKNKSRDFFYVNVNVGTTKNKTR
jgi:hypothetical protein